MNFFLIILLFLQIVASSAIFIVFKLADIKKVNQYSVLIINYIIAMIIAFLNIDRELSFQLSGGRDLIEMWPAILIGFLFMFNFILMMLSTKRVGVGVTSAFSKMSVLIPVIVGILFLQQVNNIIFKILGILLTLISFYFILYKGKNRGEMGGVKGNKYLSILLPVSVFFFSGLCDVCQELGRKFLIFDGNDAPIFIFVIFTSAFIFCVVLSVFDGIKNGFNFSWWSLFLGVLLGLSNFFASKLLLITVHEFGGSVVFPIVNASTVLMTTLIGLIFFKEKLSVKQLIGLIIAIIAVVFIALSI